MLKQAEFSNFQPYIYSLLTFCKGVNIIKGRSHSGKSALIRGLIWALLNKPRGDDFRNDDTPKDESFVVSLLFDDDKHISREKNNNKNINLYRSSESEDPFSAIKSDVPDEIKKITRLDQSNISAQDERYFLLNKTPGQAAKELNKVVGLKIIDDKKAKIKNIISDYSSRIKVLNSQIESTEDDLDQDKYKNIDAINATILNIEKLNGTYSSKESEIANVEKIARLISDEEKIIESSNKTILYEKQVSNIKDKIAESKRIEAELVNVSSIIDDVESLKTELSEYNETISVEMYTKSIKDKIKKSENLQENILKVKSIYRDIKNKRLSIVGLLQTIEDNELLRSKLEERLEEIVDWCPRCGANKKYWRMEVHNE